MKKISKLFLMALCLITSLSFSIPAMARTGVYVNGRELSRAQLVQAVRMIGQVPTPGYYWYNSQTGAYGRVGSPYPTGRTRGTDRFWSTGYSAGNSTADGSQGYVSVPGYGPVSFGM